MSKKLEFQDVRLVSDGNQFTISGIRLARRFKLDQPNDTEHSFGRSQTVPDQSYTIEEILRKYTQGVNLPLGRSTFDGLEEEADLDDLDIGSYEVNDPFDRHNFMRMNQERIDEYNEVVKKVKRERGERIKKDAEEAAKSEEIRKNRATVEPVKKERKSEKNED